MRSTLHGVQRMGRGLLLAGWWWVCLWGWGRWDICTPLLPPPQPPYLTWGATWQPLQRRGTNNTIAGGHPKPQRPSLTPQPRPPRAPTLQQLHKDGCDGLDHAVLQYELHGVGHDGEHAQLHHLLDGHSVRLPRDGAHHVAAVGVHHQLQQGDNQALVGV